MIPIKSITKSARLTPIAYDSRIMFIEAIKLNAIFYVSISFDASSETKIPTSC